MTEAAENKKENQEHLEMIRKGMDLIDDRVFLILNSVEIESARGLVPNSGEPMTSWAK